MYDSNHCYGATWNCASEIDGFGFRIWPALLWSVPLHFQVHPLPPKNPSHFQNALPPPLQSCTSLLRPVQTDPLWGQIWHSLAGMGLCTGPAGSREGVTIIYGMSVTLLHWYWAPELGKLAHWLLSKIENLYILSWEFAPLTTMRLTMSLTMRVVMHKDWAIKGYLNSDSKTEAAERHTRDSVM